MDEALGKYSKIRLIIYSLIIIWCIYLSAGFTRDLGTNKPDIHTPYQAENLIS